MKKNVMFIIGQMRSGGAERVVCNLCNNLKDEYNITLVVRTIENADYIPDVNIVEIDELNGGKISLKGIKKLKALKKELKIDTAISFLIKYNVYNFLSRGTEKVIFSVRNVLSSQVNKPSFMNNLIYRYALKKVNLVVNVSEDVKTDTVKHYHSPDEKNIVIPNFCEVDKIDKAKKAKLPKEYKNLFKGNVVFSAGRFSSQKAQWHTIRAFKEVVKYDKSAKLILAGRGDLKEYYERLIKDLNLEKNVFLMEFNTDIFPFMYNSKIFVLNSFYEGMPNVILEAMACDLPVIATDAPGGSKEIIDPKNINEKRVEKVTLGKYGVLIPAGDRVMHEANDPLTKEEEYLKDAIIMLFKDEKKYQKYKLASSKRVNDFTKEKIIKKWKSII